MKAEVTAESKNETKVEVNARQHTFEIDEPVEHGGTGAAPNPVEYELGALTGCLNVVAHLVASEKDIEIESLKIDVSGELDPAKYQGEETEKRAGFKSIKIEAEIEGDAPKDRLREVMEEAEKRCPVRDNIGNETPLELSVS